MSSMILYGTLGCHLCEEAQALLNDWFGENAKNIDYIDVAVSEKLVSHYGIRIPVLSNGRSELDWPFSRDEVSALFGQAKQRQAKNRSLAEQPSTVELKQRRVFDISAKK